NRYTAVGSATPVYDANGNLKTDENGQQYVYDAWNWLVAVKDSGSTTIASYTYDGLGRRISETVGSTTTDLYHSARWQVLEERDGLGGHLGERGGALHLRTIRRGERTGG